MPPTDSTVPPKSPPVEFLPARMLNEFVYCPRLFYYEHVEGVFVHNADTLRGAAEHTRVDAGKGDLPAAGKKRRGTAKAGETAVPPSVSATPAGDTDADGRTHAASRDSGDAESNPSETRAAADDPAADSVDSEATASPRSPNENEVIHSRSVMLGSETLAVVAKLDLVEVTVETTKADSPASAGQEAPSISPPFVSGDLQLRSVRVRPVEYKTGAPRENADGAADLWDADRMQLGLQILLLRENGYDCDEGVVFYRQTRQRVRFVLDADGEDWIRRAIGAARACTGGTIPPPLDHSPKCPRCSLVSVCLPDETRLLHNAEAGPDAEYPPGGAQLALPGLINDAGEASTELIADALAAEDASLEQIPEPRIPRPSLEGDVRRLVAPDLDTKALYVSTPGVGVTKKGDIVVVKDEGETLAEVRIKDLHHIAIFGPAYLSTALVQTLCERDVPISYFSLGGWFYGITRGHGLTNVFTRIKQFARAAEREQALPLARLFVYGKIRNQRTLLMRNHIEPPVAALRALKHASSAALVANSHSMLLGIEGAAALVYFRNFAGMIKGPTDGDDLPGLEEATTSAAQSAFAFDFKTRNRRPPRDPVNALLSFAYSLLARDCTIAAQAVGFDPYVGFYHQPRFGRPALALDVMEEFRPLVADSVVLTAINNRMLGESDFVRAGDAVNLTTTGRKRFLFAYEKRMSDTVTHPVFDYKVSYRRAVELQFRLLARTLTGEIERYVPFLTR